MAHKPLSLKKLCRILKANEETVKSLLNELKEQLKSEERGLFLSDSGGFQLKVKHEYMQGVRHLTPYQDLKRGLLRVLALVAYKQPITQSEIVKVIGNRTYEYVRALEGRGLIRTLKEGRTKALIPTKEFADYFGLEKPEDVKKFFGSYLHEKESK